MHGNKARGNERGENKEAERSQERRKNTKEEKEKISGPRAYLVVSRKRGKKEEEEGFRGGAIRAAPCTFVVFPFTHL